MSEAILLDASAVLAVILDEPGRERVEACIRRAVLGAVNCSEVVAKLVDKGVSPDRAEAVLRALMLRVEPFDGDAAIAAGRLRAETRSLGLSLGDRACLAMARAMDVPILTADRAWTGLDLGIDIEVIR